MSLLMDALKQAEQNKTRGASSTPAVADSPAAGVPEAGMHETSTQGPFQSALPVEEGRSPGGAGDAQTLLLSPPDREEPLAAELDFSEIEAVIAAENSPADPDPPEAPAGAEGIQACDPPHDAATPRGIGPSVADVSPEGTKRTGDEPSFSIRDSGAEQVSEAPPADREKNLPPATAGDAARVLAAGSRREYRARKRQFFLAGMLLLVILSLVAAYYFWSRELHVQPLSLPGDGAPLASLEIPPQQEQGGQKDEPEPPGAGSVAPAPLEKAPVPVAPAVKPPPRAAALPSRPAVRAASPSGENAAGKKPAGVSIQRHAEGLSVYEVLTRAYQAYQENRILDARRHYEKVLGSQPRNRDALLGLASVALRQGRRDEARALYRRQLEADPGDGVAQTGLLSLLSTGDPVANESLIKQMLREHGETAYLRFALGNVYAAQSRWEEAQQSYFRAYSAAPQNANYLFNLAVSLDHLRQDRMALQYYRWAVDQAQGQTVKFDIGGARQRIRALSRDAAGEGS